MSNSMNKVQLMGNLGADPELKFADTENPCLKLSLATNEVWRDKNQQVQKRTEWHRVEYWGPSARSVANMLAKGNRVYVEGTIRSRTVDLEGGMKQKHVDIRARDVIIIDYKDDRKPRSYGSSAEPANDFDAAAVM
jgi:single-strand DNA-binding protein